MIILVGVCTGLTRLRDYETNVRESIYTCRIVSLLQPVVLVDLVD